jgi:hypothetical protein
MKARNFTLCYAHAIALARSFFLFFLLLITGLFASNESIAQCGAGYTQAQLNWDNLEYYYNSGVNVAPYGFGGGNYITNAQTQTQKFGIGTNYLTMGITANITNGENGTHTGNVTVAGIPYTGDDVQYTPSVNGQTITITFNNQVMNASFTLYDIDRSAVITVSAANNVPTALPVNVTTQPGTILSVAGAVAKVITATTTTLANNSNNGTATIAVTGPVKTITITVTTLGLDPVFWLSDVTACVTGTFPANYQQTPNNQPFPGQPDYVLVTPDNNAIYKMDPATGRAWFLFADGTVYLNSIAYDPYNHWLYYVIDGTATPNTNKTLKKYDFNNNTISTVMADISTTLGIPTFNNGIESGGAAFYDGALYLGIEGGIYNNANTRECIVWRIEFNAGGTPVNAYQVMGLPANNGATNIHDWGDFLVYNGNIVNFNMARSGSCGTCYAQSKYQHYNLTTGSLTTHLNPGNTMFTCQGALTWAGNLYVVREYVDQYNMAGANLGAPQAITVVSGPAWVGFAGDASESFRPKCDFGDAPASYDPNPLAPATHEVSPLLRLGSATVDEWVHTASALADGESAAEEDGIGGAPNLDFNGIITYSVNNISVFNNTGNTATLAGWLDYNVDGVFQAGEGVTVTIPSNASSQMVTLNWNNINVPNTSALATFLRLRITTGAMTTANMGGWFADGEVEDFRVVLGTNLPKDMQSFTLNKQNNSSVAVMWAINVQQAVDNFEVYRSMDNVNWSKAGTISARGGFGPQNYSFNDAEPYPGTSYYRVRINYQASGMNKSTEVKSIRINNDGHFIKVSPNPATDAAELQISAAKNENALIQVYDKVGRNVFNLRKNIQAGINNIRLDNLSAFAAGVYTIRVMLNGKVTNTRLIINKR